MTGSYKCSCGATCTTEWCNKCGIRNTNKFNASRRNDKPYVPDWYMRADYVGKVG